MEGLGGPEESFHGWHYGPWCVSCCRVVRVLQVLRMKMAFWGPKRLIMAFLALKNLVDPGGSFMRPTLDHGRSHFQHCYSVR